MKLDPRETPPPLHFSPTAYDAGRSSTAETTPIGTPRGFGKVFPRQLGKEHENSPTWPRNVNEGFAGSSSAYIDSALLESDAQDSTFPLFVDLAGSGSRMGSSASPIDNDRPLRSGSMSPPYPQMSYLTSALQSTSGNEVRSTPAMNINNGNPKGFSNGSGRRESASGGAPAMYSGAQPILMDNSGRKNARRESIASSLVGGMSWGGVSVGSWIRDEYGFALLHEPVSFAEFSSIIMQGTSPFPCQTPSFHSSSYLPKMEANFMRDFPCCGLTLASLHDLMQHYEEHHAQQMPSTLQTMTSAQLPDSKAAIAAGAAAAVQERAQQQQAGISASRPAYALTPNSARPATPRHMQPSVRPMATDMPPAQVLSGHDIDDVQDMELDDEPHAPMADLPPQFSIQDQSRVIQRTRFGQPLSTRVPRLDLTSLNIGNPLQSHQGLRHSTPTTPVAAGRMGNIYHNNPTVSSVNTPTLTAHPRQQQQQQQNLNTPDSSVPGTPKDVNKDAHSNYSQNPMVGKSGLAQDQYNRFGQYGFTNRAEVANLCIDDPGKRLSSRDGGFRGLEQSSTKISDGTYSEDSELARTIREQQRLAGVPDPQLDDPDVPKPFHCPVIGCEKAYKNQNGLKYHKGVSRPSINPS